MGQIRFEGDKLIPVTEAERREVFLRTIGNNHHLMDLILRCINNDPRRRAHADEIVERLSVIALQFPASFANRLEMLRSSKSKEEENRALREGGEAESQRKEQGVTMLQKRGSRESKGN